MCQGLKTSVRWTQQLAIPVAVLLLLSLARPLLAAEPQERVREILKAVAEVLRDPSLQGPDNQAERKQRVRQVILDTFDFNEMAKLALGPYWTDSDLSNGRSLLACLATSSSDHTTTWGSGFCPSDNLRTAGNPSRRIVPWSKQSLSTRRHMGSSRSSTGSFTRTSDGPCSMSPSMG